MRIYMLLFLVAGLSVSTFAQPRRWAVGAKLGEPTALNLRKYGDRNALDIALGTYGGLVGKNRVYRKGTYQSVGVMLNVTYLWYVPFINNRMTAYAGFGGQINARHYYPDPSAMTAEVSYPKSISLGPGGTVGLEYFSRMKTTSFFLEGGGYTELLPDFLFLSPQLSFGIRNNF
ncbi:hypothetical protein [Arundinibacter roseus]|uniref:Outer membrane protein beta-barrel domain-containing protein n=1 Tax=Arundinibacter roseus TaxID=2070510 RepID=A0A4R4K6I6_9BACT|nr:hypothetical protein [Arundinibacter roseus]TDB61829.1 hypothetical protein EZE20_18980 [Arundinibacter roseus]